MAAADTGLGHQLTNAPSHEAGGQATADDHPQVAARTVLADGQARSENLPFNVASSVVEQSQCRMHAAFMCPMGAALHAYGSESQASVAAVAACTCDPAGRRSRAHACTYVRHDAVQHRLATSQHGGARAAGARLIAHALISASRCAYARRTTAAVEKRGPRFRGEKGPSPGCAMRGKNARTVLTHPSCR
eukprot:355144-Chlamydomonas_euryale.AAC.2